MSVALVSSVPSLPFLFLVAGFCRRSFVVGHDMAVRVLSVIALASSLRPCRVVVDHRLVFMAE